MTTETIPAKPSGLKRAVSAAAWLALVVAVLAYPAAWALDRFAGRDVVLLSSAADEGTVELQRDSFDDTIKDPAKRREAIVSIYGSAGRGAAIERVLFVDAAELIVPKEDATLALLRPTASHPVQAKSAAFAAKIATLAGGVGFVLLMIVRRFLR